MMLHVLMGVLDSACVGIEEVICCPAGEKVGA